MQRGGFPYRTIVLALFVVGTVYLLYLYNTTLGRLRDAELTAERYRREEETKTAQLQGVMRSKDELQEKCENEKREFTNRLNSLNQQHKMLKSQYDEHEVEQMRLEQETRRLREEFDQVEQQRNQEYQQLKAEKELEISNFKDQIANYQRQNEQLQVQISSLRTQLQSGQSQVDYDRAIIQKMEQEVASLQQQLAVKNSQLMQQGHGQLLHQGQGLQQGQALQQGLGLQQGQLQNFQGQQQGGQGQGGGLNQQLGFDNLQQQQQQQLLQQNQQQLLGHFAGGQEAGVNNMEVDNVAGNNMGIAQQQDGLNAGGVQGELKQQQQQEMLDHDNLQHQMLPPHNPDAPVNSNVDGHPVQQQQQQQQVQLKDEEHQVAPPNLNPDGGLKESSREAHDAGLEAGGVHGAAAGLDRQQHEDPLALQNIAPPNHGVLVGEEKEKLDEEDEDRDVLQKAQNHLGHNAADM